MLKYEIAYVSAFGNAATLAEEIADILSDEDVRLTDLSCEKISEDADIYLIGFDVDRGTVPMKIIDALELAEGKIIILFASSEMEPTEGYKTSLERKLLPFLPDDCDYKGIFLCPGQLPENVIQSAQKMLKNQPDNTLAQSILEQDRKTRGHPNEDDFEDLRKFIWDLLLS